MNISGCSSEREPRSGSDLYQEYCVSCHQKNGQGLPGRFPPLAGSEWVESKASILILLYGLQGPITVKGKQYNNVMASWRETLSHQEIANVLTYIRKSWGNDFSAIEREEVSTFHEKYGDRTAFSGSALKALNIK